MGFSVKCVCVCVMVWVKSLFILYHCQISRYSVRNSLALDLMLLENLEFKDSANIFILKEMF